MHIVFVTTELSPATNGGAGVAVARLRTLLTEAGHTVSVILVADEPSRADPEVTIVGSHKDASTRSRLAADAVAAFVAEHVSENPVDLIEVQDFDGLGFWMLADRAGSGIDTTPVQVRFHGTADLMFESIGHASPDIDVIAALERGVLAMADRVVVPSDAIGNAVVGRYGIESDRIVVGSPPVPDVEGVWSPAEQPTLVAAARLGEVKGTHDLIVAAEPVLRSHPDARLVLVGEDGWSASQDRPMSEWIADELVADDIRERVTWLGRVDGDAFVDALTSAWVVVVASRFESFHLGMHEARRLGVPVIVPALPAFVGTIDEATGGLIYDGSVHDLSAAMERVISDDSLRRRLGSAPPPSLSSPMAPYQELPTPRHPRAQSGLATAAVKTYEPVAARAQAASAVLSRSRARSLASSLLSLLPDRVVSSVARVIPKRWIETSSLLTGMRMERRHRASLQTHDAAAGLIADLKQRVANGDFPDVIDPEVSVIIPVYNDAQFLDEAIASVFLQTDQSFEIVVVNDGSDDPHSLAILDAVDWPRTTVLHQSNQGLAAARNAGIAASRGAFIVPLDVDDAIEPQFIEALRTALEENPSAAYATSWTRLTGDVDAIWIPRRFNEYQILLSNSNVGCVLMRRSAFDAVGGYDESMRSGNEDWDLWVRMMAAGHSMIEVPEVLFRYRKHGVTMSVRTEARYEEARAEMVQKHPSLYNAEALQRRKAGHYPALSIVVTNLDPVDSGNSLWDQNFMDAELLVVGETASMEHASAHRWPTRTAASIEDALHMAKGKYLTVWDPDSGVDDGVLSDLVHALEQAPRAGVAMTASETPLSVVRAWSLFDPDGPGDVVTIPVATTGNTALHPGDFRNAAWQTPQEMHGLPVQRQHPEVEGFIPDWIPT